jgi:hypothetical protein
MYCTGIIVPTCISLHSSIHRTVPGTSSQIGAIRVPRPTVSYWSHRPEIDWITSPLSNNHSRDVYPHCSLFFSPFDSRPSFPSYREHGYYGLDDWGLPFLSPQTGCSCTPDGQWVSCLLLLYPYFLIVGLWLMCFLIYIISCCYASSPANRAATNNRRCILMHWHICERRFLSIVCE